MPLATNFICSFKSKEEMKCSQAFLSLVSSNSKERIEYTPLESSSSSDCLTNSIYLRINFKPIFF